MSAESLKLEARKTDFSAIVESWGQALRQSKTEFTRDSAILRFELAYEVTWKILQLLLRHQGYEVSSPRQAFQHAFTMGWIRDEEIWDDIVRGRNAAVHVYRESDAEASYEKLNSFHKAFESLAGSIARPASQEGGEQIHGAPRYLPLVPRRAREELGLEQRVDLGEAIRRTASATPKQDLL